MIALALKVTLLLAAALCALPLMRRATAAMRHLICAMALSGALLLPLTLLFGTHAITVPVPVVFTATAASISNAASRSLPIAGLLPFLWAAGVLGFLARLALGYLRLAQLRRTAERTHDDAPVFLADVSVPLVCGILKPAILLPRQSVEWPLNQRAAALRHELAHIDRKDLFTSLMAHLVCAFYWFHPLVWAVAHRLREEQETASDDAVLFAGFEPANYAEALVATARQLNSTSLIGCHMTTSQTIKTRIARLLDYSLPRKSSTTAMRRAGVLSAALLAVIGLTWAGPQAKDGEDKDGGSAKAFKMGPGIAPPEVIYKIDPRYTDEARAAKIAGSVLLKIVVGTDGVAHEINVVSTPDLGLGIKAVEAVQQWKFRPGTKDGSPVAVQAQIEVNFRLL